jgi:hypothetical protein
MAGDVTIVWNDAAIDDLHDVLVIRAGMDRVASAAVQTMKALTPVSPVGPFHRSGTLRSSVRAFRFPDGEFHIGPTADYAPYVNDDTVPHIIRAHGPYSLHNREAGRYFGPVVHHPGTRGQHFIEKTADSFEGRVYHW